jgi:AcrR family transcriptional regulator
MVERSGSERQRLLRLVAEHVVAHGVASLTLRGLSRAVGSNNRMLLYYFGSKEALVGEAMQAVGREFFPTFEHAWSGVESGDRPLEQDLQRVWESISDPANLPFLRLFFEVFGLAAQEGAGYSGVLGDIGDWQRPAVARLQRAGVPAPVAEHRAAELIAVWRGLQMTLIITRDPAAVTAVHGQFLQAFCARCGQDVHAGA